MAAKKNKIIQSYLTFVKNNSEIPTYSDLKQFGINKSDITVNFESLENLHNFLDKKVNKYILSESDVFTKKHLERLSSDLKKYKRFVITTVVSKKKINIPFYRSLQTYCKANQAKLLLIPCADTWNRWAKISSASVNNEYGFDPILQNENFIFNETALNENLFISNIKVSAKQIKPITGLSRIGQTTGSYIFASPKQSLEFVITGSSKIPHAIMTTGALTVNDYRTDKYMSERLSYIAEGDHIFGAIVVEIQDNKIFHFRQIQAANDGSFIDLGIKYKKNNYVDEPNEVTLVLGDFHAGEGDSVVLDATKKLCKEIGVTNLIIHDLFAGSSISHHEFDKTILLGKKANDNKLSLQKEIELGGAWLNELSTWVDGKIVIVKSNHDEWVDRYLDDGSYIEDPQNLYISLDLARKMMENVDPLKYAYEIYGKIKDKNKIVWLKRDDSYKIDGVECGSHGDLGLNGSKGTLTSLEKAFGNCIVGHIHSGAILRGVWRVGTCTKKLSHERGPTSHTATHCFVYKNGQRQLINIIYGKYRI